MPKLPVILTSTLVLALSGLACSSDPSTGSPTGGSGGSAGSGSGGAGGTAGSGSGGGGAGGTAGSGSGGGGTNQGGSAGSATGGVGGSSGSGGTAGSGGQAPTKTFVYVGGGEYADGTGKLRVFDLDEETAALSPVDEVTIGWMNSFIAFHPTLNVLYAGDEQGKKLRAYSIGADGKLTFLNDATTTGGPVYVSIDKTGKFAFVSFYNEGSVQVFSLGADGSVGTSVDSENTGANAHSIVIDPTNSFVFVPNKGANAISQFALDATTGALTANTPPSAACEGGPRHLAFSANGDHAYVIAENGATITTFDYDDAAGTLTSVETIPVVPADFAGNKQAADIHVTPDGKFLYGTNRATTDSTIGMYSIGADGKLTNLGFENTRGSSPRNFSIHPNGKLLLVGNHDSDNVASFRILDDGKLEFIETTAVNDAFWVGFRVVPE
jgi:6-phosphogluconolactonase